VPANPRFGRSRALSKFPCEFYGLGRDTLRRDCML
jgi:hypothetical protein